MDQDALRRSLEQTLGPDWETGAAGETIRPDVTCLSHPGGGGSTPNTLTSSAGFRALAEIARGGQGVISRGWQESLQRQVALKHCHGDSEDEQAVFVAEALVTGLLEHPNVVPVYDFGLDAEGRLQLAMKLVGGRSWGELLRAGEDEGLDLMGHVDVLRQVCNALAFAHEHGIAHRDLKPENVMVGRFGEVVVMDWGLAVDLRDDVPEAERRTQHTSEISGPAGTPAYMAPEQAEGAGAEVGVWTDVFLLGATLYEVLTGRPPYQGRSLLAVLMRAAEAAPPPINDDVPPGLATICRRAMARAPAARYPSASAFREALDAWIRTHESEGIARRAREAYEALALADGDYLGYGRIIGALDEALLLWPNNYSARETRREASEALAWAALRGGDFGLARAQVEQLAEGPQTAALRYQLGETLAQQRRERRSARLTRLALVAAVLGVFASLLVGLGRVRQERLATEAQRVEAEVARDQARSSSAVAWANALRESDPSLAARLLRASEAGRSRPLWREAFEVLSTRPIAEQLYAHPEPVRLVAWSASGRLLTVAGEELRLLDPLVTHAHDGRVAYAEWSPDGHALLSRCEGRVRVWWGGGEALLLEAAAVVDAAWTSDGRVATRSEGAAVVELFGKVGRVGEILLSGPPKRLLWGPDRVLAVMSDHEAWIYGVSHPRVLARISQKGLQHRLVAAAWSAGGRLATSSGHFAYLWPRLEEGAALHWKEARQLAAGSWIFDLDWSADGERLAAAAERGVPVWDSQGERLALQTLRESPDRMRWSPQGRRLLTVSHGRVQVRDETGTALLELSHRGPVSRARWSPDGKRIATGAADGSTRVWPVDLEQRQRVLRHEAPVHVARFDPTGRHVVVLSRVDDNGAAKAHLWDVEGHLLAEVPTRAPIWDAAFAPDGEAVALAIGLPHGHPGRLEVWGRPKVAEEEGERVEAPIRRLQRHHRPHKVHTVAWHADALVAGDNGGAVTVYTGDGRKELGVLEHEGWVRFVTFAPDGALLTGTSKGVARIFGRLDGPEAAGVELGGWLPQGAWGPKGDAAVVARGRVVVLDASGAERYSLKHGRKPWRVAWSAEGLLATSAHKEVTLWSGGVALATLPHGDEVTALAWRSDGAYLAAASADGAASVWSADGELVFTVRHADRLSAVSWSPDGQLLLSASYDGLVKLTYLDEARLQRPRDWLERNARTPLPEVVRAALLGAD